jgi:hypothetical protein
VNNLTQPGFYLLDQKTISRSYDVLGPKEIGNSGKDNNLMADVLPDADD